MLLITQIVEAIQAIQNNPETQPLVFVVPVSVQALEASGRTASELEDLAQGALTKALNDALIPVNAA